MGGEEGGLERDCFYGHCLRREGATSPELNFSLFLPHIQSPPPKLSKPKPKPLKPFYCLYLSPFVNLHPPPHPRGWDSRSMSWSRSRQRVSSAFFSTAACRASSDLMADHWDRQIGSEGTLPLL